MATTTLVFELSIITAALNSAWNASDTWQAMTAEMVQWHQSGEYPDNQAVAEAVAATGRYTVQRSGTGAIKGSCAVIAANILKWARSGKTPRTINECVTTAPTNHVKSKAGRKAGEGAGKTTKPEAKPEAKPELIRRPVEGVDDVLLILRDIASRVPKLGLSAEAQAAGREAILEAIAFFVTVKVSE